VRAGISIQGAHDATDQHLVEEVSRPSHHFARRKAAGKPRRGGSASFH
jgi:hypothetical protein